MTTTHYYNAALASSPARYHRAQRGGNKVMNEYLERAHYDNNALLACCNVTRHNNNKQNKHIMATKSLIQSELGQHILKGIRSRIFDDFCASLLSSLTSSASEGCGVGRITYAALVAAWRKDTVNGAYALNETEGRKLLAGDVNDSRVRRVGVEGHWSFFVSSPAAAGSDSILVLVGGWLRSWAAWYDSIVRYGHYGEGGVPAASCVSVNLLERCRALWSWRGVGGRVAATSEEKKQRKVAKAVEGLNAAELLAALKASGVDLSALVGGAAQSGE